MRKVLFFLIFLSFSVFSQEKGNIKTYSLKECLDIALQNNPQIKIAETSISVAGAEITSAFGNFLPSVNFSLGYTRQLNQQEVPKINIGGQTLQVGKIEPNSYNMGLSVSYDLFDGFRREAYYSQAKDKMNSAFSDFTKVTKDVTLNVIKAYANLVRNKKILESRKQDFEIGKKDLERIRSLYEVGSIPFTNVLSQEAELTNKEIQIITAENEVKNSKAYLLSLMGVAPELSIDVIDSDLPEDFTDEEIKKFRELFSNFDKIVDKAFANRLEIISLNQQIEAGKAALTIARATYFPTLSTYGGWSWANSEFNKFSELGRSYIGLSLRIPIFENFRTNYQIELARAQLIQLDMQKLQVEQTIRREIITSLNNLESAEKQLIATRRSLEYAEKNFQNISEKYRLGSVSSIDYYYANNLFINSKINHINAVIGYYIAQKEILYATGQLDNK
ncbi:MAG: TolC family protein [Ignavibacteria bacterium]|nr:TolC family protein [Ignavibacteria bacterium]